MIFMFCIFRIIYGRTCYGTTVTRQDLHQLQHPMAIFSGIPHEEKQHCLIMLCTCQGLSSKHMSHVESIVD